MTDAWLSRDKTGDRRPVLRATIQYVSTTAFPYQEDDTTRSVWGNWNSVLFAQPADVIELPGIESISWSRGVTQDVAEATLKLRNSALTPIGQVGPSPGLYDDPGAMVPTRGIIYDSDPWGFIANGWEDVIVPDRMIRTYEGYGCDPSVYPAQDPYLKASGVWLIDEVTLGSDGTIEIKMRDVGRLLIDQISILGTVPYNHYPLTWSTIKNTTVPARFPHGGTWHHGTGTVSSSGKPFVGHTITTTDGTAFVSSNGVWAGNYPKNVLNSTLDKVWISTGNSERYPDGPKVWWQQNFTNTTTAIAGVQVTGVRGPYVVYVSLWDSVKNAWIGKKKIPALRPTEGVDVGAHIPFVAGFVTVADKRHDFVLPHAYKNISKIRLTFRPGANIGTDDRHPWRAGVREIKVYTGAPKKVHVTTGTTTRAVGNINDYTDAIKWMLGWCGFFWPNHSTDGDYQQVAPGTKEFITFTGDDAAIPGTGRIWGDFMDAGTGPVADLTPDLFDKQPIMDAIGYIRDTLGFIAYVDETGGFIWRMPNIWTPGNYLAADDLQPRSSSTTTDYLTITDNDLLLHYTTTSSSKNLREAIFVGNTDGRFATLVAGYGAISGVDFHRIAGYLDQHFASQAECDVMADIIATKQKFSYRTASVTIPGYPGIQIDDQIRIYDKTTNETYFHYVESIANDLDMVNGTWTYQLSTHWLGEQATASWVIDVQSITHELRLFLTQLGII